MTATMQIGMTRRVDSFEEALFEAVRRQAGLGSSGQGVGFEPPADKEVKAWIVDHREDLMDAIESFLPTAVSRIARPKAPPTKPALEFDGGRIRVWVADAAQRVSLGEHRSFQFGGDDTASLIYEEREHGHNAIEHNIDNASTWEWIQKWMSAGMAAMKALEAYDKALEQREHGAVAAHKLVDAIRTQVSRAVS